MKKETAEHLEKLINREFPWMNTIVSPQQYDNSQYSLSVYIVDESMAKSSNDASTISEINK